MCSNCNFQSNMLLHFRKLETLNVAFLYAPKTSFCVLSTSAHRTALVIAAGSWTKLLTGCLFHLPVLSPACHLELFYHYLPLFFSLECTHHGPGCISSSNPVPGTLKGWSDYWMNQRMPTQHWEHRGKKNAFRLRKDQRFHHGNDMMTEPGGNRVVQN